MVVLNSTIVLWVVSDCMFSLATLPLPRCSTVLTDVTSLTPSPTLVTLLKRTCISEDYCWYVSLQCYETEIQRRREVQYVPQCYNKMYLAYITSFFGGNLGLEHLHSPTHTQYLVARILNWRPVYHKIYLRN